MRKLSAKRRQWLDRQQRIEQRRNLKKPCKKKAARQPTDTLTAPSYFCLFSPNNKNSKAPADFFTFIRSIRNFQGKLLCVDMRKVQRMVVDATIIFKAEIEYLTQRGVSITALPPKKHRTLQVLSQTGIVELLRLSRCEADREDTIHWRHTSGRWNYADPSLLSSLLNDDEATDSVLYRGMVESVFNSIEHAYQEHPMRRSFSPADNGWWGFQQLRDGILSTCICDLGIGIQRALPLKLKDEPTLYKTLISLSRHLKGSDVRAILAAVEYGKSGTKLIQRGKGLRDAHSVIDEAGEGLFHIFSNRGMYVYSREQGQEPRSATRRLADSIEGTIYFWQYPIQSQVGSSAAIEGVSS